MSAGIRREVTTDGVRSTKARLDGPLRVTITNASGEVLVEDTVPLPNLAGGDVVEVKYEFRVPGGKPA